MKSIPLFLLVVLAIGLYACNGASSGKPAAGDKDRTTAPRATHPDAVENALPFTIGFREMNYGNKPALPRLQSYVAAVTPDNAYILVCGGRRQGLHTFMPAPANNFIADSSNNFIYVIDPATGDYWSFDVNTLPPDLAAPLKSTNQQPYHDMDTDILYIVGGYGWKADTSDMITFNTIIAFNVSDMANAVRNGQPAGEIARLIRISEDEKERWAVTGGELYKMDGKFYLVFGQKFMGQYRAFGGSDFSQKYTEEVRVFTLNPNTLSILSYGASTNTGSDRPFHRRDGNIIEDIDPATGRQRITALGGVFKPGIIAPYTYPVFINSPAQPVVDTTGHQKFSQYECPVISVFDSAGTNAAVYHTFFGGIGHYYYFQTPSQKDTFDIATKQGRNDGFPFVADITTFLQRADGTYDEFIHTEPIIDNRLLGASIRFIPRPELVRQGRSAGNKVILLHKIPQGEKVLAGYIYGGIEAQNPLPAIPNTGTWVSNTLFEVYVTHTPSAAIPASQGHESHIDDSGLLHKE